MLISDEELCELIETSLEEELPSDLDALSTHTRVESVDNICITERSHQNGLSALSGSARVTVELQYGSDRDQGKDLGERRKMSFPFTFEAKLDPESRTLESLDCSFDTDSFYE